MEPIHFQIVEKFGYLPIRSGELYFAVGSPDGNTSNTWKIWEHNGSIYIACRDNFQQAKISLHPSNWRMAFTKESNIKMKQNDRTWEEWQLTTNQIENAQIPFRLFFSSLDLGVTPRMRTGKKWKNIIYVEAPPDGKLTAISIFILEADLQVNHESEPSFCLASFTTPNDKWVKVIAHGEPEGNIPQIKRLAMERVLIELENNNIDKPPGAYAYFLGHLEDESRFLCGTPI